MCDGSSGSVILKHYGTTKLTTVADGVTLMEQDQLRFLLVQRHKDQLVKGLEILDTIAQLVILKDIPILGVPLLVVVEEQQKLLTLQFLPVNPTGVGSFATASFRSASVIAQIDQTGSGFQVGRYLMIHDGTNVTVVEESAVATGDMLGSFDGAIVGSNAEFRVTMD